MEKPTLISHASGSRVVVGKGVHYMPRQDYIFTIPPNRGIQVDVRDSTPRTLHT